MGRRKSSGSALNLVLALGNVAYQASKAAVAENERKRYLAQRAEADTRRRTQYEAERIERQKETEERLKRIQEENEQKLKAIETERLRIEKEVREKYLDNGATTFEEKVMSRIKLSSRLRAIVFIKDNHACTLTEAIERVNSILTHQTPIQ